MTYEEVKEYWKNRTNIKINDKKINKILFAYKNGSTQKLAAQYAGITQNTLKNWIKKGETCAQKFEEGQNIDQEDFVFYELWQKICECETEIQIEAFNQIRNAAAESSYNWRASVEILKMRFGNEYSQQKEQQTTNEENVPFKMNWYYTKKE
jgi:hypothetical protein